MDAVFADPSASHHDAVANHGFFLMTRLTIEHSRHDRTGSTVNQRLTGKSLIEDQRAVDGGNTALVTTVLDTFDHALENAARMQQSWRQGFIVKR